MALARLLAKVEPDTNGGCWLWSGTVDADGYGRIMVNSVPRLVHRVSFAEHYGDDPAGLCVCHRCDVRACVNPDHLFLGSRGDNNRDRAGKNRSSPAFGSGHYRAKLNEAAVGEILRRLATGEQQRLIAKEFGVDQSVISEINTGRKWRHVERTTNV